MPHQNPQPGYPQFPGQQPPVGPQYYGPPRTPKKKHKWPWIVGGVVLLLIIISVLASPDSAKKGYDAGSGNTSTEASLPAVPPPPVIVPSAAPVPTTVPTPPAPPAPKKLPKNGTLKLGKDIAPGEYTATATSGMGYWERLSCLTGAFECVMSNDIVQGSGYVTLDGTEVAIKVQDLQLTPVN